MCSKRLPRFNPLWRGSPLFNVYVPRSGLSWDSAVDHELARVWAQIPPSEWDGMDGGTKAIYIAVYMIQRQGEAVIAKEQADEVKRNSRAKGNKGRAGRGSSK